MLAEASVERTKESWLRRMGDHAWALTLPLFPLVWAVASVDRGENRAVAAFLFGMLALLGLAVLPLVLLLAVRLATRRRRIATVSVDEHGLQIDGETIPPRDLALAWRVRRRQVEVFLRSGDELSIDLLSELSAEELAAAIRARCHRDEAYTLGGSTALGRMGRQMGLWVVPMTVAAVIAGAYPPLATLLGLAGAAGFVFAVGNRRLRFAADGVEIQARFRKRYVPYRSIAVVRVEKRWGGARAVVAELRDGTRLSLLGRTTETRAELVRGIVDEGVAMAERGASAGAHVPDLERAGGEDDEHLAHKIAGVGKGGSYRGAAIDPDRLVTLMRNPAADADQRIAAALALRETREGRTRIRVAAEVSAEPGVREALESLADEELEEAEARRIVRALGR